MAQPIRLTPVADMETVVLRPLYPGRSEPIKAAILAGGCGMRLKGSMHASCIWRFE